MDARGIGAKETIPASRKLGRAEAAALAEQAQRVVVAKGKNLDSFAGDETGADTCVDAMLGPTGNLRAPTIRVGRTVMVGFNEAAYQELFA